MKLNDWWVESFVRVYVECTSVGSAQVWNPTGGGRGGSLKTVRLQDTAGFVAIA